MAQPNLLEIVPDELFQTHNIASIVNVQKKLHSEIELKREELRAMVGERYRELIHAADTIEEMRESTAKTLNHIDNMISTCRSMQSSNSAGFKVAQKPLSKSVDMNMNPVYIISVQVKILMVLPEKIWRCIDNEDFITATQLFILARHINTGLQLQIGANNANPGLQSMQRLIQQQWNSIANFNSTIVDLCKRKLQDVNITVEVATACLVSLHFLDSQSVSELLDTLIALTCDASLRRALTFDLSAILDGDVKANIKGKIVEAVKIIVKTVALMYACFVESDGGAIAATLSRLLSRDAPPLIRAAQCGEAALAALPAGLVSYRLTAPLDAASLGALGVAARAAAWRAGVHALTGAAAPLLGHAARARALHDVRAAARAVELPKNWSQICTHLDLPQGHVWANYFQHLFTARVKEIIEGRWGAMHTSLRAQMLADLARVCSGEQNEANINWFVWKDLIGDTVIESRADVVDVMSALMRGMSHQDRGYTPTLEALCRSTDAELQGLLDDLKAYLHPEPRGAAGLPYACDHEEPDSLHGDSREVLEFLRDVTDRNVQSILQYVKACCNDPSLQTTELQKKTTAIYTARFTQAIIHLMPHLYKCYVCKESQDADAESVERWNNVCSLLKETTLYCWGKWVDIALVKVQELTALLPQEFTLDANVQYLMMQWDTIQIEEKDDEGNTVETHIKLPSGPSLKLQEYLYAASRVLDEIVPHTIPSEIHAAFVEKLADISLAHFDRVIREKGTDINQRCALQLLMDVRHLTMLLVVREDKRTMDRSQEVCELLRQRIDPFDYDVFYPYIQSNLKRSVQRVQTLLGSLVLNHAQLSGVVGKAAPGGGPALLAGAGEARQWFSLLPLAAPLATRTNSEQKKKSLPAASPHKPRADPSEPLSGALPINFASARSGAASFFNSISTDWFSGS